jgi:hypothetical protein
MHDHLQRGFFCESALHEIKPILVFRPNVHLDGFLSSLHGGSADCCKEEVSRTTKVSGSGFTPNSPW